MDEVTRAKAGPSSPSWAEGLKFVNLYLNFCICIVAWFILAQGQRDNISLPLRNRGNFILRWECL